MTILGYILLFTSLGSIVSLLGGIILLTKEKLAIRISHFLASFAAGALLGTAFFDLMPEAAKEAGEINIFFWTLFGMLIFFLLERSIHWFHHHHEHPDDKTKPVTILIVFGDAVHNFIDGIVITAAFLVDVQLGIVTAVAVGAHEIPQEIGDFGILLHNGVSRKKVLILNILSAVTAIIGALLVYFLQDALVGLLPVFLSITAGFFIYIAASDLIPEIHNEVNRKHALIETVLLLLGVLVVWLFITLLEG
jgi:zinc and cadmium transporter